jgi:hypothetical protein
LAFGFLQGFKSSRSKSSFFYFYEIFIFAEILRLYLLANGPGEIQECFVLGPGAEGFGQRA